MAFRIGAKVRVEGFPRSTGLFDYNGLVGEVRIAEPIGTGLNDRTVYQYLVHFTDVDIPYAKMNPQTNKLDRGITKGDAENFFEEDYLVAAQ